MLSDIRCRNAKPRAKPYKLSDAHGMYLHVKPSGLRVWRLKYRYAGKEQLLTMGRYPLVSLRDAREARDDALKLLHRGTDPRIVHKLKAAKAKAASGGTFEAVARDWHTGQKNVLAERYAQQVMDRLEADVFPAIGSLPIDSITPALVLAVIRVIEARGAIEMAKKVRQHISAIFVFGMGVGLTESDPAAVIRSALQPQLKKLRPAILKLTNARAMLSSVESVEEAYVVTKLASRLLALTAVRPGVLRLAQIEEFEGLDGNAPIWRIPAAKMKLTRQQKQDATYEFVVPLSTQAVAIVQAAIEVAGDKPYLFHGFRYTHRPISDSTLSKFYRDAGFTGQHVPHGWRSSFSTIMNELAAVEERETDREIIDLMLAHIKGDVEAAYNRAAYMPRRREIAQSWADMLLEGMPPASSLLPAGAIRHECAVLRRHRTGQSQSRKARAPAKSPPVAQQL